MKPKSPKSIELYHILIKRGYPEEFCDQITRNLNTDWTAQRMIGYLSHYRKLPPEDPAYIPVVVNFVIFFLNDMYGFVSWKKRERGLHYKCNK